MSIAGFLPFTTIDFPEKLSCVVFFAGCMFKCRYCHNHDLVTQKVDHHISWPEILAELKKRKKILDAVVFSGGEPLLEKNLENYIDDAKSLGYQIGLHTTGYDFPHFAKILPKLNYVGFDIKAPFKDYDKITLLKNSAINVRQSAKLLIQSGVFYEFRTTVHPLLLSNDDLLEIIAELKALKAKNYKIQKFQKTGCQDQELLEWEIPENYPSQEVFQALSSMA